MRRVWIWTWVIGAVLAGAIVTAQQEIKTTPTAANPVPAKLSETQQLKAELLVSKLQRVDAQLTALQAQLALVAGERDRLQAEARALEPELITALGGTPGKDRLDWNALQLVKAEKPPTVPE